MNPNNDKLMKIIKEHNRNSIIGLLVNRTKIITKEYTKFKDVAPIEDIIEIALLDFMEFVIWTHNPDLSNGSERFIVTHHKQVWNMMLNKTNNH